MTMKALDKLLGRSTIDPTIHQAFEEGRLVDLLNEYGFAPEAIKQLRSVEAKDFDEFAEIAFHIVERSTEDDQKIRIPDPMEGLRPEKHLAKEEQAA
jgi:hypothetical protein